MGQTPGVEAESLSDLSVTSQTSRAAFLEAENAGDGMFAAALSGPITAADLLVENGRVQGVTQAETLALDALGGLELPDTIRSPQELADYVDSILEATPGGLNKIAATMARDLGRAVSTDEARQQLLEPAVRKWSEAPISAGSLTESAVAEVIGE